MMSEICTTQKPCIICGKVFNYHKYDFPALSDNEILCTKPEIYIWNEMSTLDQDRIINIIVPALPDKRFTPTLVDMVYSFFTNDMTGKNVHRKCFLKIFACIHAVLVTELNCKGFNVVNSEVLAKQIKDNLIKELVKERNERRD